MTSADLPCCHVRIDRLFQVSVRLVDFGSLALPRPLRLNGLEEFLASDKASAKSARGQGKERTEAS
jgi:hypothetical protein